MAPAAGVVRRRALTYVWRHRTYRVLFVAMVLTGVAVSSYIPLISLFLVRVLGVSDATIGLYALTGLAAPVVGIAVGRLSDRLGSRTRVFVVVALWLALGRLLMGLAPSFAVAVGVGVVFGAFGGVLNAQVFAVLKDTLQQEAEDRQATVGSAVRTGYSLGWVIGPVLGSSLAAVLGLRGAVVASGVLVLVTMLPLRALRGAGRGPIDEDGAADPAASAAIGAGRDGHGRARGQSWGSASLWLFALVALLALTGEGMRLLYLPVLAVDRLGVPLVVFGAVLALAPAVELVAMPAAGVLADRFGIKPVMVAGLVLGALGFCAFAVSSGLPGLLMGQLLNACFIAVVLGLGVTYAQQLHPGGAAFAASVFFAAGSLSAVTSGTIGAVTATSVGLPAMFFAPAALCAGAGVLMLVVKDADRLTRRHGPLDQR